MMVPCLTDEGAEAGKEKVSSLKGQGSRIKNNNNNKKKQTCVRLYDLGVVGWEIGFWR